MASHYQLLLSIPLFLLLLLPAALSSTFFLPVFKTTDHARPQYHSNLQIGTPPVPVTLTIDVNNAYTWLDCNAIVGYNHSSSYSTVHCHTPDCDSYSGANAVCIDCNDTVVPTPMCNLNQCGSLSNNPITTDTSLGFVVRDSATLYRLNTPSSSPTLTTLPRLPISCVASDLLKGLSKSTNGVLSFARATFSIEFHVSYAFKLPRKFSVCLPSSAASTGRVYFGGGPYSGVVSKSMVSLPLLVNAHSIVDPFAPADPSVQYYVKLSSIEIDGSPVKFNSSFLSFDGDGNGGTLVSTIAPYGKLRSEIYEPFVALFLAKAKAKNVKTVKAARKEFGACFDPKSIQYDPKTGSGLPVIDLVLEGKGRWRIFGSNSVVEVTRGASCLAFVETRPRKPTPTSLNEAFPAVVIGGVQMEDNLLEFDVDKSMLGISSSLLTLGKSCSKPL